MNQSTSPLLARRAPAEAAHGSRGPLDVNGWTVPDAFLLECRSLASMLADRATSRPSRTVAFTSLAHGAGVSTVVRALAMYMAQQLDEKVLLLSDEGDKDAAPGMRLLLSGEAQMAAAVRPTSEPMLSVLGPGRRASAPAGTADRARTVMSELRNEFGYVLVDMAPVTADWFDEKLLRACDGAVVVLEPYRHDLAEIERAVAMLRRFTHVFGLVFNKHDGR
jgi:Mrp family chromosome partitioning ATPase